MTVGGCDVVSASRDTAAGTRECRRVVGMSSGCRANQFRPQLASISNPQFYSPPHATPLWFIFYIPLFSIFTQTARLYDVAINKERTKTVPLPSVPSTTFYDASRA